MKSQRIRVHGDAAKMSLDVNSLALRYFGISFSMMATTSEAFFCHKCRAKAEGLAVLIQNVQSVEKDLASAICVVFEAVDHCKKHLNLMCWLTLQQIRGGTIRGLNQVT